MNAVENSRYKGLKVVLNVAVGRMDKAVQEEIAGSLALISGQKPLTIRARKSVSNFNIREGMDTGFKVTLRHARAFNLLHKVLLFVWPSSSEFRGLKRSCRAGSTMNFGVTRLVAFPEVREASGFKGMHCHVSTRDDAQMDVLLEELRVPFY